MKRITVVLGIAALAALLPLTRALAETTLYKIDPNHSVVGFSIRHLFSKVPGRFNEFEGTIQFDDKNMAASSVETTIKTASIFTNQEKRDNHLRSADFFAADSFPTITFKSTKVTAVENNKFQIEGDLTIRGRTKRVVLDAELLGVGATPMGTRAGFEATTTVNRKDFGVLWNKTLDQGGTLLGDDVAIDLGVEAVKAEPKGQGTAPPPPGAGKK